MHLFYRTFYKKKQYDFEMEYGILSLCSTVTILAPDKSMMQWISSNFVI